MKSNDLRTKSDNEIVKLTIKSEVFFAEIMARYEKKLMFYICKITDISKEEAEDLLQDIFIKVYSNLNGFDDSLKFSSWVYRISHNEVISHFRKKKIRPEGNYFDLSDNIINNLAEDFDFEKNFDYQYIKDNIFKVLERMDVKYKEVLILKYLEEKDYREISDILQKPSGTVGTLINRAKKQFKRIAQEQKMEFK